MNISLKPIPAAERDILDNLLQLYMHDFSSFSPVEIDTQGKFNYPYLNHYWQEPDRQPFFIFVEGTLAGFTLLREEVDPENGARCQDVSEFFVLRQFRRAGIGSRAAITLWDMFPGEWQVRVMKANVAAYRFWQKLIQDYSRSQFEETFSTRKSETIFLFSNNKPL